MNKLVQTRVEIKRGLITDSKSSFFKFKESMGTPTKIQSSPEFLFFESLKNILDNSSFKSVIKLLYLYNEVIILK